MTWLRPGCRSRRAGPTTSRRLVGRDARRGPLAAASPSPRTLPIGPCSSLVASLMVRWEPLCCRDSRLPPSPGASTCGDRTPARTPSKEATVVQATTAAGNLRAIGSRTEVDTLDLRTHPAPGDARASARCGSALGGGRDDEASETYQRIPTGDAGGRAPNSCAFGTGRRRSGRAPRSAPATPDAEEATLSPIGSPTRTPSRSCAASQVAGNCDHLRDGFAVPWRAPEGCGECRALGMTWVHLRLCTTCGHVGCCDSHRAGTPAPTSTRAPTRSCEASSRASRGVGASSTRSSVEPGAPRPRLGLARATRDPARRRNRSHRHRQRRRRRGRRRRSRGAPRAARRLRRRAAPRPRQGRDVCREACPRHPTLRGARVRFGARTRREVHGKPGDDGSHRPLAANARSDRDPAHRALAGRREGSSQGGTGGMVGGTASTVVHFADLDDAEIEAYVATGEPLRVAGAFTIDESRRCLRHGHRGAITTTSSGCRCHSCASWCAKSG